MIMQDQRGTIAGRASPSVSAIGDTCAKYAISAGPPTYVTVGKIARSTTGRSRTLGPMSSAELIFAAALIATRLRPPDAELKTRDRPGTSWTCVRNPARSISAFRSARLDEMSAAFFNAPARTGRAAARVAG